MLVLVLVQAKALAQVRLRLRLWMRPWCLQLHRPLLRACP